MRCKRVFLRLATEGRLFSPPTSVLAPAALSIFLAACAPGDDDRLAAGSLGVDTYALQNGQPVGGAFMGVGQLTTLIPAPGGGFVRGTCTATLITPRTALTAAHCVRDVALGCRAPAGLNATLTFADAAGTRGVGDVVVAVDDIIVHPDAYFNATGCDSGGVPTPADVCTLDFLDCRRVAGCDVWGGPYQGDVTRTVHSLADIAILFLARDVEFAPIPAVVESTVADDAKVDYLIKVAGSEDIGAWGPGKDVTRIGYGDGSQDYPAGSDNRGRDAGLATWLRSSSSFDRVTNCTNSARTTHSGDFITTYPDDVTWTEIDALPDDRLANGASAPLGGTEVWTAGGDSGGPVIAGSVAVPVGAPTAFPAPSETLHALVAVHSRGGHGSAGGTDRPISYSTATWRDDVSTWLMAELPDSDGDTFPDPVDDHPDCDDRTPDPDGDGLPNDCDPCPCDPLDPVTQGDRDGVCECRVAMAADTEGFCAGYCPGRRSDNCPTVANANQDNHNADAERVRGADVLGDACDPVPVPAFDPIYRSVAWGNAAVALFGQKLLDYLSFTPTGSHSTGAFDAALPIGDEVPVDVAHTHYRFCRTDRANGIRCMSDEAVSDAFLTADADGFPVVDRAHERLFSWWHRVTITTQAPDPDVPEGLLHYDGTRQRRTWDWEADFAYWRSTTWGSAIPGRDEAAVDGRFWIHAETDIGASDASAGTGLHWRSDGAAADGLANVYQPVEIWSAVTRISNGSPPRGYDILPCRTIDCSADKRLPGIDERIATRIITRDDSKIITSKFKETAVAARAPTSTTKNTKTGSLPGDEVAKTGTKTAASASASASSSSAKETGTAADRFATRAKR